MVEALRILRITSSFPEKTSIGKFAGLEPNVFYISREQVREGHEVMVATTGSPDQYEMDGFEVLRFPVPRARRWTFGLKAIKTAQRAGFEPDIVHGLNPMTFGWLFPLAKKAVPSRYVFSMHGSYHHSSGQFARLVLSLSKRVDKVVAVSPFIAKDLVTDGVERERVTVIPSGVDTELFKPAGDLASNQVLYVGSFRAVKRVGFLVRAFSDILSELPSCQLKLVGGTPGNADFNKVLRMIRALGLKDSIEVVPPVSHFEMPSIYSSSAVVAMTSEIEGLGKILLEAGAVAKPTVAPRVGGISYVIDNGINGLMYRPGNLRDLRKALITILSRPKKAGIMGKHARRNVLKKFAWKTIARRFSLLFEELKQ